MSCRDVSWKALTLGLGLMALTSYQTHAQSGPGPADFKKGSVDRLVLTGDQIIVNTDKLVLTTDNLVIPVEPFRLDVSLMRSETATTIEFILPADVLFDFDKAEIKPAAAESLAELAGIIRDRAKGPVRIEGHTDSIGVDTYNQRLSERRAAAVKAWLVSRENLPANRFATAGFGKRSPAVPNTKPDGSDDPKGRQLNRRVVITARK